MINCWTQKINFNTKRPKSYEVELMGAYDARITAGINSVTIKRIEHERKMGAMVDIKKWISKKIQDRVGVGGFDVSMSTFDTDIPPDFLII